MPARLVLSLIGGLPRQALLSVIVGCVTVGSVARANDAMSNLTANFEQQHLLTTESINQLATHITWRRLLHYADDAKTSRVRPDTAQASAFFVSPTGHQDPQAELTAMLTALLSADDATLGKQSVQCRFPARTQWLADRLSLKAGTDYPQAHCPDYDAWMQTHRPTALAVIFAQEYPDSMTSAFAHTLLRIDTTASPQQHHYQHSYALNYTVNGNENDNMVSYAYQSFTGGYPSMVTIEPYPQKIAGYLKQDQRDIWSYRLRLSDDERQQFIRHIWETKDLGLPYYFMTDNCASEILRVLDVVKPNQQLFRQVRRLAIPSEIVRLLDQADLLDKGEYLPSDASLQQAKRNAKPSGQPPKQTDNGTPDTDMALEQNLTAKLWADNDPSTGHGTQRVGVHVGRVGARAYSELTARIAMQDLLDAERGYRQFLDLQTGLVKVRVYERADDASELTTGLDNVQSDVQGNVPSEVNRNEQRLELNELTLIKTRSYHPINTARAGNGNMATWGGVLQAKQVNDASLDRHLIRSGQANTLADRHLVANVTAEKGVAIAFGQPNQVSNTPNTQATGQLPSHLCYGLLTGAGQVGKGLANGYRVGAGVTLGCRLSLTKRLRATAELQSPYWYQGDSKTVAGQRIQGSYWQPIAEIGVQYDVTQGASHHKHHSHAIRLTASHELNDRVANPTEVQLGWQWYF